MSSDAIRTHCAIKLPLGLSSIYVVCRLHTELLIMYSILLTTNITLTPKGNSDQPTGLEREGHGYAAGQPTDDKKQD